MATCTDPNGHLFEYRWEGMYRKCKRLGCKRKEFHVMSRWATADQCCGLRFFEFSKEVANGSDVRQRGHYIGKPMEYFLGKRHDGKPWTPDLIAAAYVHISKEGKRGLDAIEETMQREWLEKRKKDAEAIANAKQIGVNKANEPVPNPPV